MAALRETKWFGDGRWKGSVGCCTTCSWECSGEEGGEGFATVLTGPAIDG